MGGFGWKEEHRDAEIKLVYNSFFEGIDIPDCSARLHKLLTSEVKAYFYDESSSAYFDRGKVIIKQWEKKEFYHDGSEQSYKEFSLELITAEEYMNARGEGIFEKPSFLNYSNEWFENLEDFFFVRTKSIYERYDIYARDLLGLGFVKLTLDC